jgi:acetyl-CoA carboxylase, biotin carboxylase subunit
VHYDPMISKLVVWGDTRTQAVARMRRALDEYQVSGIETNLPFHRRCLRHDEFIEGRFDTGFIARNATTLTPLLRDGDVDAALVAAILEQVQTEKSTRSAAPDESRSMVTAEISAWRQSGLR